MGSRPFWPKLLPEPVMIYCKFALLAWVVSGDIHNSSSVSGRHEAAFHYIEWRHNLSDGVSNHRRLDCLLNRLFRRRSKKTSKFRVTGLYGGIHRWPVNSSHIGPATRKILPFDDVILLPHRRYVRVFNFYSTTNTKQVTPIHQAMMDRHAKMSSSESPLWSENVYMMTSSNGNIFRVTGLCAGNSPVPMNSPHKGQWRGALVFSLICFWIND